LRKQKVIMLAAALLQLSFASAKQLPDAQFQEVIQQRNTYFAKIKSARYSFQHKDWSYSPQGSLLATHSLNGEGIIQGQQQRRFSVHYNQTTPYNDKKYDYLTNYVENADYSGQFESTYRDIVRHDRTPEHELSKVATQIRKMYGPDLLSILKFPSGESALESDITLDESATRKA
jgi:hypothetical protein